MQAKKIIQSFKEKLSKKNAPEFEIFFSREHEVEVEVKDQQMNAFNASESMGVALRVIVNHQLGFSYTTDFSEASIQKCVDLALSTSHYSNKREFLSLAKPEEENYNQPQRGVEGEGATRAPDYDPQFLQTSQQTRLQKALEMEKAALSLDPRLKRARGASYSGSLSEVYLENSWGLKKQHEKTMNVLSLMAVAEEGEEAEGVFEFDFSAYLEKISPEEVGRKAAQKALNYLGGKPGPTLKCPVILDPLVAAEVLEVLAPSFYADNLLKKRSLFENKQSQFVLSPQITLIDDGRLSGGYSSFPFDGEGIDTQKTVMVEEGIFRKCLADLEYGNRYGEGSTGSSERENIKSPPQISHSNLYLKPGFLSFEKLLSQVSQAIYITELIGMHTANPISGDFSVGAQGFWVEKGEVKFPLKQIALSGNLNEMLNKVQALGSDLRYYFKVGSPSILIEEMDVAGA